VLPALAKLVAEPGKEIRAAALEALGVVYAIEGDGKCTSVVLRYTRIFGRHTLWQKHHASPSEQANRAAFFWCNLKGAC
jgi:hypothetical protein